MEARQANLAEVSSRDPHNAIVSLAWQPESKANEQLVCRWVRHHQLPLA